MAVAERCVERHVGHVRCAIDMAQAGQRKRYMVDDLIAVHLDNYRTSGAELVMGTGRFVASNSTP